MESHVFQPVRSDVSNRDEELREQQAQRLTADNCHRDGRTLFASNSQSQRSRRQARDDRRSRHQHGTQACPASLDNRLARMVQDHVVHFYHLHAQSGKHHGNTWKV
jgi:hypothetical protein